MKRFHLTRWCWCLPALALASCNPEAQQSTVDEASQALPALKAAQSLSRHYVEVVFAGAVGAEAEDAGRYQITGPNDGALPVKAARRAADDGRVILTTGEQSEVLYTLKVAGSGGAAVAPVISAVSLAPGSILFKGSSSSEPYIASALALDNTTVLVTFSEVMDNNANVATFYRIESPDLKILTAAKGAQTTVQLTTEPMAHLQYTLKAYNISAANGNKLIDPDNSATFQGIPPVDTGAPQLLTAAVVSDTKVLLSFSEPLADGATDPLNFAIAPSLLVTAAELSTYNTQVLLTTLPMQAGIDYTVTVGSNVKDKAANAIDAAHKSATFKFNGQTELNGAGSLPRVVGAIALSNTSVRVTFSKAMGSGLDNIANYSMTGAETSYLAVFAATAGADRTYVDLTTSSQSPGSYTVRVVNVKDTSGNPLMGPSGLLAPPDGVDPATAVFAALPPVIDPGPDGVLGTDDDIVNEQTDTDADGIADFFETAGWFVTIKLANGTSVSYHITSDIFSADTDGDGLGDAVENQWNFDPRSSDTDVDYLGDYAEFNVYYSDPLNQDTDGDGVGDFLEIDFFKTAPTLADSDGDQWTDGQELFERNRNPLISDLPRPAIDLGDFRLSLDTRFTFTDTTGTSRTVEENTTTEVQESTSQTFAQSDTNTTTNAIETSAEIGYDDGPVGSVSFGYGYTGEDTIQLDQESTTEMTQAYQESLTTSETVDQTKEVTREVVGARMDTSVTIRNVGDIAFSISNLEVTAVVLDARNHAVFKPVGTLLPAVQGGVFNLGPFVPEKGPFIFSNTDVFPSLVEDLLRNPRGLLFRVANYDITDEFGRNFAFTSQEVNDVTAGLTIDFGTEALNFRIATYNGFVEETGQPKGIKMRYALENILGIQKGTTDGYATTVVNGVDKLTRVRNVSADQTKNRFWAILANVQIGDNVNFDDIDLFARNNVSLAYVKDEDFDGLIDREEYLYGSSDTQTNSDTDTLGDYLEVKTGWTVQVEGKSPFIAFSDPTRADSDADGLPDHLERTHGTDPRNADTDGDGISDRAEVFSPCVVFPGANGIAEINFSGSSALQPIPFNGFGKPTDIAYIGEYQGACTAEEVALFATLTFPGDDKNYQGLDPLDPDTDDDGLKDGVELVLGSSPLNRADAPYDTDNDGLLDSVEKSGAGWTITVRNADGTTSTRTALPSPLDPDSDDDGLPDLLEQYLGSDPRNRDTDNDGLLDFDEFKSTSSYSIALTAFRDFEAKCLGAGTCTYDPTGSLLYGTSVTSADTDQDGRSDAQELFEFWTVRVAGQAPYDVTSSPTEADRDRDNLDDGEELALGTDPSNWDTDGDGIQDDVDGVSTGNGKTVTFTFVSHAVGEDDCEPAPDCGDFSWSFTVTHPGGSQTFTVGETNLCNNGSKTFSSNESITFTLRPGESFSFNGSVREDDPSGNADERWTIAARSFTFAQVESITSQDFTYSFSSSAGDTQSGTNDPETCYNDDTLTVRVAVSGA